MNRSIKSIVVFSLVAMLGIAFSSGCRKKQNTTAKITVRDIGNELVIGATVRVAGDLSIHDEQLNPVDETQTSDYKGETFFSYNDIYQLGQAGVAVLEIHAEKGNEKGDGIIKIDAEIENTETVYIQ
jgi:hypothetical protein